MPPNNEMKLTRSAMARRARPLQLISVLGRQEVNQRSGTKRTALQYVALLLVAVACRASGSSDARATPLKPAPQKSAKEDCEDLMNAVLPFAREMLSKHREFYPFGAAMSPSG